MSTPISDRLAPTWRRTLVDDLVELTHTLTDRASDTEARLTALEQRLTDGAAMSGSWEILKLHAVVAAHTLRIAALEQRPECPCARLRVPESDATAPSGPDSHMTPETAQGHTVDMAEYNRGYSAGWKAKADWDYRHRPTARANK